MLVLVLRRLGNAVAVMLTVAFVAFTIFRLLGDPVQLMLNPQASQAERDDLRERLGLNRSPPMQFVAFVGNAARGEFGVSYRNQQSVGALIAERFPATFELVMVATVLALLAGVPAGVYAAIHRRSRLARLAHMLSMVGISVPAFVIGILLILAFAVELHWLPAFGRGQVVDLGFWKTGLLTGSGRAALVMPALSLATFEIAFIMRLVTAEMLEVMRSDYVKFARARGLRSRSIHFRHALRNCLMPVVTVVGMMVGELIAFALVTETVFQWPGMGFLFVQAVTFIDVPVMAAYLMVVALIFVSINTMVDLLYLAIDPRLRAGGRLGGAHA